jgi:adenylosuccinate synthase
MKELKICKAYKIDGKETTFFPANLERLCKAECIYETVEGWEGDLSQIRDFGELPQSAQDYVLLIEKITKRPITIIGVGPKRDQIIFR